MEGEAVLVGLGGGVSMGSLCLPLSFIINLKLCLKKIKSKKV